jgi:hypothetical protein
LYRFASGRNRDPASPEGAALIGHLEPFVRILEDLDLDGEAERFRALLPVAAPVANPESRQSR